MSATSVVTDVTTRGVIACVVGVAVGIAQPALLPGVVFMCMIIYTMDL